MEKRIIIIGAGDVGKRVARLWQDRGARVAALARSEPAAEMLSRLGIDPIAGDLDQPESLRGLPTHNELVYYFAPPPESGTEDPRMEGFLAAIDYDALPERIVYISTTGVYGNQSGNWVDEHTPVHPQNDRARRRVAAEQALTAWGMTHDVPVVILRVAGIYGPGKLPLDRLRRGTYAIDEAEAPPSNRIHIDDLAAVCVAAGARSAPGEVFNVSDGHPSTMTQYFNRVADLAGLPRPHTVSWEEAQEKLNPAMLAFLRDAKRVSNRKMLEDLGATLRYTDLDEGIEASLREMGLM